LAIVITQFFEQLGSQGDVPLSGLHGVGQDADATKVVVGISETLLVAQLSKPADGGLKNRDSLRFLSENAKILATDQVGLGLATKIPKFLRDSRRLSAKL
jgi:hypothetical protein